MSATYNGVEITFYLGQRSQDKHEVSILLPLNLVSGVVIAALFHVDFIHMLNLWRGLYSSFCSSMTMFSFHYLN